MHYQLRIGAQDFSVEVSEARPGTLRVSVNGKPYDVIVRQTSAQADRNAATEPVGLPVPDMTAPEPATETAPAPSGGGGAVLAPIPGLILEIKVRVGDTVQAGQSVAVMEAMKMENNLTAGISGVVQEILVQKGSEVATGDVILRIG